MTPSSGLTSSTHCGVEKRKNTDIEVQQPLKRARTLSPFLFSTHDFFDRWMDEDWLLENCRFPRDLVHIIKSYCGEIFFKVSRSNLMADPNQFGELGAVKKREWQQVILDIQNTHPNLAAVCLNNIHSYFPQTGIPDAAVHTISSFPKICFMHSLEDLRNLDRDKQFLQLIHELIELIESREIRGAKFLFTQLQGSSQDENTCLAKKQFRTLTSLLSDYIDFQRSKKNRKQQMDCTEVLFSCTLNPLAAYRLFITALLDQDEELINMGLLYYGQSWNRDLLPDSLLEKFQFLTHENSAIIEIARGKQRNIPICNRIWELLHGNSFFASKIIQKLDENKSSSSF